ncbi:MULTISPECIES: exodeoxyribonuclease VII small subunit [unclassified Ligilactobacillus]|uniref:exodeoxyribonuclease VII small subunit n=1 Tax=unclassified Ligilactobacillus TaxID=2767920 RepID=UPI0038524956
MAVKQPTFEEQLSQLEQIVKQLEQGDLTLDDSLAKFKQGVTLSKKLQHKLADAEQMMTQIIGPDGNETDYQRDTYHDAK